MWNYSAETTTLISEITVHTQNVAVPGATASLQKGTSTKNLWTWPDTEKDALKLSRGHKASAQAHAEWSVSPPGKSGQTHREKATRRGRQSLGSCQSHPSDSKDRGQPPEVKTDSRNRSPSEPPVAHTADTGIFTDSLHNRDKVHTRSFQLHSLWHIIATALGN